MNSRNCFILFTALILHISPHKLHAQDDDPKEAARQLVEIADEAYQMNLALDIVREQYEAAANIDPANIRANFMTGELYIMRGPHKERATQYLLKVLELDPSYRFDILYKIGQGYQYGLQFDLAIEYYNKYKEKLVTQGRNYRGPDKVSLSDVERRIFESNNGKIYVANPENFSIVNIGEKINSEYHDFAPVLNENETVLIFTTRRQDGNTSENVDTDAYYFEDIFISRKVNGEWTRAENIGNIINTPYHDSNLALSPDGKTIYIYRDENGGDIYYSEIQRNGNWSVPQPLPGYINSSYFENGASISPDNKTLFFSSDRPGGYGGRDIYMATKDSRGMWSRITNIGPKINTEFDDEGPFIDYDGKTLYFSSRGHDGMGGFDIYISQYDSATNEWSTPLNLGFPVNTPDDDVYFVGTKDRKRGYYSSVRDDGMGYTDIYMVVMPDLSDRIKEKQLAQHVERIPEEQPEPRIKPDPLLYPVTLVIRVEDLSNSKPIDATLSIRSMDGNVLVPIERLEQGVYRTVINNNRELEYMVTIEKQGYAFRNTKMSIPAAGEKPQEIRRRFELKVFEVGTRDVLRNIYFKFDSHSFTQDSYFELNKLERMLHENPNFVVEIAGHTDNIGTVEYNMNLSQLRARAVVNYLVKKGIDPRRLKAQGYGKHNPLASNDNEKDGRELNRRVEFVVVGNMLSVSK
jgi:outer membrane protein OmpA-like peptidoglycan-associated protein/Tol biopolymer transport system component